MTDQPQGPTEPREEPSAPPPTRTSPRPRPRPSTPRPPPRGTAAGPGRPGGSTAARDYGAPQQQPVYGRGATEPRCGTAGLRAPQQPGSYPPPAANPYGGYTQAPAYAGGRPMHPGSVGYVEQYFGPVADFGQRALALHHRHPHHLHRAGADGHRLHRAHRVGPVRHGNVTTTTAPDDERRRRRDGAVGGILIAIGASSSSPSPCGTACSGWGAPARAWASRPWA